MSLPLPYFGLGSEQQLRDIADHLPDGLFTTDADGLVTFWNRAAEQITGWAREEAIGQSCSLLAGNALTGCACGVGPIRCGLAERSTSSKTCTIRTKDGRELLIVKNAVPLLAPDGQTVGALETFASVHAEGQAAPSCELPRRLAPGGDFHGLVGRDPAMLELYRMVELVARSGSTVMILGESGSGKELVAEAVHRSSPRAAAPFVRVSCSALNENLLESELFGHVRGAFTGALRDRRGSFQEADGGTLLLDEIGDISPLVQLKLLRVIEQREIERVGESLPVKVDVRLLCATHRDLRALVREGCFRADLYFRLSVFPLRVPPLREHPDDIAELAARFLAQLGTAGAPPRTLSPSALAALRTCRWAGNVRELQNVLEYAALQSGAAEIRPEHLPLEVREASPPRALRGGGVVVEEERRALVVALERTGWNRTRAAELLGVSRVTLWKRMKRHAVADPAAGDG
jgi:two-component system, NtrC family, response regulator HydG